MVIAAPILQALVGGLAAMVIKNIIAGGPWQVNAESVSWWIALSFIIWLGYVGVVHLG